MEIEVVGPLIDLIVYFAARGLGLSPGGAQLIGFIGAAAFIYLPRAHAHASGKPPPWNSTLVWHVIVVSWSACFLRAGVFALAVNRWGWAAEAAIIFTAAATAAVVRPAYAYCMSCPTWSLDGEARWRAIAAGAMALALLLRLVYSAQVELLPEEAYYWNYSRHLDFGYLDHPPMVAWLIRAGTAAFGSTEFGVRIGALCSSLIAAFFSYRLTRNLFGEPSGAAAAVLMQTLPFFFLSGFITTPDAPLAAAWSAALYFLERALIAGRSGAWWWAGACMGLGLLSKYTVVLLGGSTLLFLLLDSRSRPWLRRVEPYGAALLALAIFAPVIVWNAQHEWASFLFQTSRRLAERPRFALHNLIAAALILLTPTGLAAAIRVFGPAPKSPALPDMRRGWRFIQLSIAVPLAVFTLFSLRHEVKLDWTGVPWIGVVPALGSGLAQRQAVTGLPARMRRAWVPTLSGLLMFYAAGLYHLALGIPGLGYSPHTELLPVGWRQLAAHIGAVAAARRNETGEDPLIVGMDRNALASELAFYLPDRGRSQDGTTAEHLFGQVGLMYERWSPAARQRGRTLLLVAWKASDLADARLSAGVERLEPIQEWELRRNDRVVRRYYYRFAEGYRGAP